MSFRIETMKPKQVAWLLGLSLVPLSGIAVAAPKKGVSLDDLVPVKRPIAKKPTAPKAPARKAAPAPRRVVAPPVRKPAPVVVLRVSPLGGTPYRTISQALKKAPAGARVLVRSGVYTESLVLERPVEIAPLDPASEVIVEGSGASSLTMRTDQAVVRGLTLRQKAGDQVVEHTVDLSRGRLVLESCQITSGIKACVGIRGMGTKPYLRNCRIQGGSRDGVLVTEGAEPSLEGCEISGHGGHGMSIHGAKPSLRDCTLHDNQGEGLHYEAGGGAAEDCELYANAASGAGINRQSDPVLRRVKVHDNRQNGISVSEDGQGALEACDIYKNAYWGVAVSDSTATLLRIRVHHSPNAIVFKTRSRGTMDGCVLSENGAYGILVIEGSDPAIRATQVRDTLGSGLVFRGSGTRGTVLDCEISGSRDWECVGFSDQCAPTLRRCRIHDGKKNNVGIVSGASPVLVDCEIWGAGESNVGVHGKSNPSLTNCRLHHATAAGIWIEQESTGTLEACSLYQNRQYGLMVQQASNPTVRACRFYDNAQDGIQLRLSARGTFEGCDIYGNGTSGVGITDQANPTLRKCRIYNGKKHGLAVTQNGRGTLIDCDLFGNATANVAMWDGGQPTLSGCRVE